MEHYCLFFSHITIVLSCKYSSFTLKSFISFHVFHVSLLFFTLQKQSVSYSDSLHPYIFLPIVLYSFICHLPIWKYLVLLKTLASKDLKQTCFKSDIKQSLSCSSLVIWMAQLLLLYYLTWFATIYLCHLPQYFPLDHIHNIAHFSHIGILVLLLLLLACNCHQHMDSFIHKQKYN